MFAPTSIGLKEFPILALDVMLFSILAAVAPKPIAEEVRDFFYLRNPCSEKGLLEYFWIFINLKVTFFVELDNFFGLYKSYRCAIFFEFGLKIFERWGYMAKYELIALNSVYFSFYLS